MSVRSPSIRGAARAPGRAGRALALCCIGLCLLSACSNRLGAEPAADSGPCGRGKARSCLCNDGRKGIAQCLVGLDWGECWCGEATASELDGGSPRARDAAIKDGAASSPLGRPKSTLACDEPLDLRAHAASGSADPYLIPGGGGLGTGSDQGVCFYFKPPYPAGTEALGYVSLPDEVSQPSYWLLYGIDATDHHDGEIVPCGAAESASYLLAGFSPADGDSALPSDVGLALPSGVSSALILEVHYADPVSIELLDRTGVRVCTAPAGTREHTAAVHTTGSEAICLPAGAREFEVTGTCTPRSAADTIHILSVWPRMLQLGTRMKVSIERQDGGVQSLYDESFKSPLQLRTYQDVTLAPGETLETSCFYDNPGLLSAPFGTASSAALCYAFVTAWPAGSLSTSTTFDPLRRLGNDADRCLDPLAIFNACF